MARTSLRGSRRPALVAVLLAALVGLHPAAVQASPLPDDVTEWFTELAAQTVADVRPVTGGTQPQVAAGEPRPLYQWSHEFRHGEPTDEHVAAIDEWIAPFAGGGEPAGVVVAWRHEGEISLAYTEEDADLAAAIAGLPPEALVVHEPVTGAHFAVEDGTVSTLRSSIFPSTEPLPLADFQPVLAEQVAQMSVPDEPEGGSRRWGPAAGVVALMVVALLLAAAAARRRRGSGHT